MYSSLTQLTDAVLDRGVESVYDSWTTVGYPIGLVHRLTQLVKGVIRSENVHIQHRLQITVRIDGQLSVVFLQLRVIHDLIGVSDMRGHGLSLVESSHLSLRVHPLDLLQDLCELSSDVVDHLQRSSLSILLEVFANVQGTNGDREAMERGSMS